MSLSPITVSQDGRFLREADGRPFFWLGDTAWAISMRLDKEEADRYLRARAAQGFTVLQAVAAGSPFDGVDAPNREGEPAFIGGDPARPNERYFDHVAWLVDRAAELGLRFALLPIWAGNEIQSRTTVNEENAEAYGTWIARRLEGRSILWVLGGDIIPVWRRGSDHLKAELDEIAPMVLHDYRPVYDALAAGIRSVEGEGAFITYHPAPVGAVGAGEPRTSVFFADRPWLTMNMLETGHVRDTEKFARLFGGPVTTVYSATEGHRLVEAEYRSYPTRPVIDGEPRFEGLAIDLEEDSSRGLWSSYHARNSAYHAVFAGAAGHTYGHHSVWQFFGSGDYVYELADPCVPWETALRAPTSIQMSHLRSLMLSRPYFSRIPDQGFIVGPAGRSASDDNVQATRDREGSYAMVYLPHGGEVVVNLLEVSGTAARAWWFDPRTGRAERIAGEIPTDRERRFVAPTTGPDEDWVLVIDDASKRRPAPGTP